MTKDEALKMAIETIRNFKLIDYDMAEKAINACKEALEQPAQEPVAWIDDYKNIELELKQWMIEEPNVIWQPLYTHPHQWQGLTDDEKNKIVQDSDWDNPYGVADAIEQALRNKNYG